MGLAAQESPEEQEMLQRFLRLMETKIQVASHRDTTVLSSPSVVTVVDRETLQQYGIRTVAEAVALVPGMASWRTAFFRDVLTSRGVLEEHYSNRILFLIEGTPVWEASTGAVIPSRIPIEDVERIEVLKGPASVLYGSNAYAGAINVVLRRPAASEGAVEVGIEDQGGYRLSAQTFRQGGGWSLLVGGHVDRSFGEHLLVPGEGGTLIPDAESVASRTVDLRLESRDHQLLANVYRTAYPHLGITLRPSTGGGQDFRTQGLLLGYAFTHRWGEVQVRYGLAFDQAFREYVPSPDGSDARRTRGNRLTHTASLLWDLGSETNLEVGGSHERRTSDYFQTFNPTTGAVKDENHLRDVSVDEHSALVQLSTSRGPLNLILGARSTKNQDFGRNLSGRGTLGYALGPRSGLKLVWGQSFRAPTMLEQYTLVPGVLYGNLNARPETSDSLELEYIYQGRSFSLQLIAYQARFQDKLVRLPTYPRFTSDPRDTSLTFANGPAFGSRGLEAALDCQGRRGLGGFLHLTWLRGDHDDRLPTLRGTNYDFVPSIWADAGLSQRWGAWTASALLAYEGRREGPLGQGIPAQAFLDAHLEWRRRAGRWEFRQTLDVKNAFAEEQRYPEFVRRNINDIPDGLGRRFSYGLGCVF